MNRELEKANKGRRVLLLLTVWPFPCDNGKKVVIKTFLHCLGEFFGKKNVDIILLGRIVSQVQLDGWGGVWKFCAPTSEIPQNLVIPGTTFQQALMRSREGLKLVASLIKENDYVFILADTLRAAQFIPSGFPNSIVYLDDLFHVRYERIIASRRKYNIPIGSMNILGNFGKNLPIGLSTLAIFPVVQLLLLYLEKRKIRLQEIRSVRHFSRVLLINPEEIALLKALSGACNVYQVKPLVRSRYFERRQHQSPYLLFLGDLGVPHNRLSIEYFVKSVYLPNEIFCKRFRLMIVGKNIPESLARIISSEPRIRHVEFANDLSTLMSGATAMIIPLLFGSGVKIKTLEAMAAGLPFLATNFGVEGVELDSELRNIVLEDDLSKYPQRLAFLAREDINQDVSRRLRQAFLKGYSEHAVFTSIRNALGLSDISLRRG